VGVIFDIKRFAIHDGPGIRTTVFLKGCPLRCAWCHNPEGWEPGVEAAGPDGKTIGREVGVAEVVDTIERDVLFYDQSGGGATFSGGEPLAQPAFLEAALRRCRARGIHTTVDTACCAPEEVVDRMAPWTDLWLCDVKHMDPAAHERHTGRPNERILANIRRLADRHARMILRMAIVPGVNDDAETIEAAAAFAASLAEVERVDLLPYHRLGCGKARRFEREKTQQRFAEPEPEATKAIAGRLRARGLAVQIGG
jgi:pyruvate formate lyase activating enzyme